MVVKLRFAVLIVICFFIFASQFLEADPVRVSAVRLMAWLDEVNPPLVLDVRGREVYRAGTLPGAFNAGRDPFGYLPDDSKEPVVLVVPVEADSKFIEAWRRRLADAGHEVWVLDSGFSGWKAIGGAVETSDVSYTKPGRVPFVIPRGLCEGNEPAQTYE